MQTPSFLEALRPRVSALQISRSRRVIQVETHVDLINISGSSFYSYTVYDLIAFDGKFNRSFELIKKIFISSFANQFRLIEW